MNLSQRIRKLIAKAIFGFDLLEKGDKIVIALSGGEDSLVLTHYLSEWIYYYNTNLHIYGVHLDMGFPKDENEYEKKVQYLRKFCEERGIVFLFEKLNVGEIVFEAEKNKKASPCFLCSWYRRKYLFNLVDKLKVKKLVLGHHKDDVIATFFMNMFYCGELSTILPKQSMFNGNLFIIRPLYFVEKDMISRFVKLNGWQVLANPCPYSDKTKRAFWNKFLEEHFFSKDPVLKRNVFSAFFNPKLEYLPSKPKKGKA